MYCLETKIASRKSIPLLDDRLPYGKLDFGSQKPISDTLGHRHASWETGIDFLEIKSAPMRL